METEVKSLDIITNNPKSQWKGKKGRKGETEGERKKDKAYLLLSSGKWEDSASYQHSKNKADGGFLICNPLTETLCSKGKDNGELCASSSIFWLTHHFYLYPVGRIGHRALTNHKEAEKYRLM